MSRRPPSAFLMSYFLPDVLTALGTLNPPPREASTDKCSSSACNRALLLPSAHHVLMMLLDTLALQLTGPKYLPANRHIAYLDSHPFHRDYSYYT
ncbi:hypothetical protein V8F33_012074 [Rhypophila sp. PSN 637]